MNRIMDVEQILNNPRILVGSSFPHPDCKDVLLTITRVNTSINASWDDNDVWRNYILVELEDGTWCRYWLNSDMEIPKIYED